MPRIFYIVSIAILAGIGALIALSVLNGSVQARKEGLRFRLENARAAGTMVEPEADVDYESIQYAIAAKPNLWSPLTTPQKAAVQPPDLAKILNGVSISRNTVGSGDNIKIKVTMPEDRAGQWVGIGATVRGLRVKSIDRRGSVTFSQQFQGREYTYTLTQ